MMLFVIHASSPLLFPLPSSMLKKHLTQILTLKALVTQLSDLLLLLTLVLHLLLLGQLLHKFNIAKVVSRGGVIILVQVDLPEQEDVLPPNEEDASLNVGIQPPFLSSACGAGRDKDSLPCVLKHQVGWRG